MPKLYHNTRPPRKRGLRNAQGKRVFFTESAGEAIRHLNTDRLRVTDIEGNAYDLLSVVSLDPASRERLSRFL
jgi:hypothetical protein